MAFKPVLLSTGLTGWAQLKSSLSQQKVLFSKNYQTTSIIQQFRNKFFNMRSPEDVVGDRNFLLVLLNAYGLGDDIDNTFFIAKVLKDGVVKPSALANRLSDQRYRELAADFDFTKNPIQHISKIDLMEKTISRFQDRSFEIAVGERDQDMRLALSFSRQIRNVAQNASSNNAAWYQILATPPLREVIQTALGFPSTLSQLDIDDQHKRMIDKASGVFGSQHITDLAKEDVVEQITRRFLVKRQAESTFQNTSFQTALFLLRGE